MGHTTSAACSRATSSGAYPNDASTASVFSPTAGTGSMRGACAVAGGRQQRRQRAGRAADFAPALARLELRMRPDAGHVVDAGVGDLRVLQPLRDLIDVQAGEGVDDQRAQRLAIGGALRVGQKARILGQFGLAQHLRAEHAPLAFVLQAQHDGGPAAHGKRPVGIDGGVGRARAQRRRRAVKGVVHGIAHPLDHAFQHGHVDAAALAGPAAQQQRVQDGRIGIHAGGDVGDGTAGLDGPSAVPVTDTKPLSLWISRS